MSETFCIYPNLPKILGERAAGIFRDCLYDFVF